MHSNSNTALLIIDIQKFYYPGGKWQLVDPEAAGKNAARLLERFRASGQLTVHIRHNSQPGFDYHPDILPQKGEKEIVKNHVNSFLETDLHAFLQNHQIKKLVICGMMTHMCVEAATRAASDLGYECTLIADACATKDLPFRDHIVKAIDVHHTVLSAMLDSYATVLSSDEYFNKKGDHDIEI